MGTLTYRTRREILILTLPLFRRYCRPLRLLPLVLCTRVVRTDRVVLDRVWLAGRRLLTLLLLRRFR